MKRATLWSYRKGNLSILEYEDTLLLIEVRRVGLRIRINFLVVLVEIGGAISVHSLGVKKKNYEHLIPLKTLVFSWDFHVVWDPTEIEQISGCPEFSPLFSFA